MQKYIHLAFCCLLSSMLFQAHAMQQEVFNHAPGAERAIAELSALTQDDNSSETRGKLKCDACPPKDNCCTRLQCREIINTLNLLAGCTPTPLSQSDVVPGIPTGTLTISVPGSYCLGSDITGNIVIAASQVTLDLNCHQVMGLFTVNNQSDIFVTNGVFDGTNDIGSTQNEVTILFGDNIHLSELTVRNSKDHGIFMQDSSDIFISNVLSENNTAAGVFIVTSAGIFISDSVFNNNDQGIRINNTNSGIYTSNVIVTNCHALNNGREGFAVFRFTQDINFYNCTALQNRSSGFAFNNIVSNPYLGETIEFNAFDCVSERNGGDGFFINNVVGKVYLERCLAQQNTGNGFNVIAPDMTDSPSGTMSQCVALNNGDTMAVTGNGFLDGGSTVKYISNYAQGNVGMNYNPLGVMPLFAPFNSLSATTANISFWNNIFN